MALSAMNNLYTVFTSFRINLVQRYFLFVLRVLPFMQSPVRGCRSRSTDDTLCLHHLLFGNACISVKLLPFYYICNNKSQLLLHPYMPSHLINLKNQLRYRLLNMWKLFCVRLLSSFLVTNDNKVALAVVRRKKLWKARLKIMRIVLFFDTTGVNNVKAVDIFK